MSRRKGKATPTTTRSRAATGRERGLVADPMPVAIAAALDAVARHRATGEPLERALHDVAQVRRLGPRERRAAGDAAFAWARRKEITEKLVDGALTKTGGIKPSRRDRDLCAMLLGLIAAGIDIDARATERLPDVLLPLVDDVRVHGGLGAAQGSEALPSWLSSSLAASGEDVAALAAAVSEPALLVLALDPKGGGTSVAEIAAAVAGNGGETRTVTPSPIVDDALRVTGRLDVRRLPPALRDRVWPMDDGSQAIARAVDAQPGELVLDVCAGGGGKSRMLATTGARVVSADVNAGRLRAVSLGDGVVGRVVADGCAPPFAPASFDRVLVDAPCSGTGTLRRAPDLAHRLQPDDVNAFAALQKTLLAQAIALVKPGGLIVYATCSLLRAENEDVIAHVLDKNVNVQRTPIPWRGVHVDGTSGEARLRPHVHGCDGFFVAALTRSR